MPVVSASAGTSSASLSQNVIQGKAEAQSVSMVALYDAVQIQRLVPAGVTTPSTFEAVVVALSSSSPVHGAKAGWANVFKAIVTLSFGDGRNSPMITSPTTSLTTPLGLLHILDEFDMGSPITNAMVVKAVRLLVEIWDAVCQTSGFCFRF